jgi:hypothetical protein
MAALAALLVAAGCARRPLAATCDTTSWQALISEHEARYPGLEMADVYKLLHQATMGSEHAVPSATEAAAWMAREVATLGDGPHEPMVDTLGSDGRFVRIHLRPYLAAGGSTDSLVAAFVETARSFAPDTSALACALASWRSVADSSPTTWNPDSLDVFIRARKASGYGAIEHSGSFVAKYRPAYRVIARGLLRSGWFR